MDRQGWLYFSVDAPSGSARPNLTLTVSSVSGDPDLYVACAGQVPSSSNSFWQSRYYGDDSVDVYGSDPHYCTGGFVAGVYGFTNATFVIEAHFATPQPSFSWLVPDVPVSTGVARGEYLYYAVFAEGGDAVDITVTPRSGDPDLFVSCSPFPTLSNYHWRAWGTGVDSVRINGSEPDACGGRYYISVYGFQESDFTLVATSHRQGEGAFLLVNRQEEGVVYRGQQEYFQFNMPLGVHADIRFTVHALTGDPDLYVHCDFFPNQLSQYTWHSTYSAGRDDVVVVQTADPSRCASGSYKIAVHGFSYGVFQIEADIPSSSAPVVAVPALRGESLRVVAAEE